MEALKLAIDRAGGVPKVAEAANITAGCLYNILNRKRGMGRRTASKLRGHIYLQEAEWNELLIGSADSTEVA